MASPAISVPAVRSLIKLELVGKFPNVRALAWDGDVLYAARGYTLLRSQAGSGTFQWNEVARYRPQWWRNVSSRSALSFRLARDGFHALAITREGDLVAAVPGAIATLRAGETEFRVTHRLLRGTRPLHLTAIPDGRVFWGEYFDNPRRDEVHIYSSADGGFTWGIAYTFASHSIRHVHNIVYDSWKSCLWIFTGDYGSECRILRASLDFRSVEEVARGSQQARAVAAIVAEDGIYFASDTPLEQNYIYFLDRSGRIHRLAPISSSSICAAKNRNGTFFSTMVEPSEVNRSRTVTLVASADGNSWSEIVSWRKDGWPMKFFQYGNAFLPDGENNTDLIAVSTIAVENADLQTTIWRTNAC
jgi:hypothetical protein